MKKSSRWPVFTRKILILTFDKSFVIEIRANDKNTIWISKDLPSTDFCTQSDVWLLEFKLSAYLTVRLIYGKHLPWSQNNGIVKNYKFHSISSSFMFFWLNVVEVCFVYSTSNWQKGQGGGCISSNFNIVNM